MRLVKYNKNCHRKKGKTANLIKMSTKTKTKYSNETFSLSNIYIFSSFWHNPQILLKKRKHDLYYIT